MAWYHPTVLVDSSRLSFLHLSRFLLDSKSNPSISSSASQIELIRERERLCWQLRSILLDLFLFLDRSTAFENFLQLFFILLIAVWGNKWVRWRRTRSVPRISSSAASRMHHQRRRRRTSETWGIWWISCRNWILPPRSSSRLRTLLGNLMAASRLVRLSLWSRVTTIVREGLAMVVLEIHPAMARRITSWIVE